MRKSRFVVKIGGSILRQRGAADRLLGYLAKLPQKRETVLVFGSGSLASVLNAELAAVFNHSDRGAHLSTLLVRDCVATYAVAAKPMLSLADSTFAIEAAWSQGRLPVLRQSALVSWLGRFAWSKRMSSDSVAGVLAGLIDAQRLILLKDVAGIYDSFPPIGTAKPLRRISTRHLRQKVRSCVDPLLPSVLELFRLRCLVASGMDLVNVASCFDSRPSCGTWIDVLAQSRRRRGPGGI